MSTATVVAVPAAGSGVVEMRFGRRGTLDVDIAENTKPGRRSPGNGPLFPRELKDKRLAQGFKRIKNKEREDQEMLA